jgi:hypothetical protein
MQKWVHHLIWYPDNMILPFRWKSDSPKATLGRLEMTNQTGVPTRREVESGDYLSRPCCLFSSHSQDSNN